MWRDDTGKRYLDGRRTHTVATERTQWRLQWRRIRLFQRWRRKRRGRMRRRVTKRTGSARCGWVHRRAGHRKTTVIYCKRNQLKSRLGKHDLRSFRLLMLRRDVLLITSSETRSPDFQGFRKLIFESLNLSCMRTLKDVDLAVCLVFEVLSLHEKLAETGTH